MPHLSQSAADFVTKVRCAARLDGYKFLMLNDKSYRTSHILIACVT